MDKWIDGRMDGQMGGWGVEGGKNRGMDGQRDTKTDKLKLITKKRPQPVSQIRTVSYTVSKDRRPGREALGLQERAMTGRSAL